MTIEEISFNLISLGGESFSVMMEALEASETGNVYKQQELMNDAEKLMNQAHNFQTKLLTNEAQGNKNEINVLLIHAQDTLMNTILAATLIKKMCGMNERLLKLEGKE